MITLVAIAVEPIIIQVHLVMAKKQKITKVHNEKQKIPQDVARVKLQAPVSRPFESFPLHLLSNERWKPQQDVRIQELVPGRVVVIPEFFTSRECETWVSFCETSGGLEYTAHPATKFIAHRECFRMQQTNATVLAQRIFERMKSYLFLLPLIQQETASLYNKASSTTTYKPIGCNPNLRVYKYLKGHSFGKHVDGSDQIEIGTTEWTVLVYLTECQGGATRFYTESRKRKSKNDSIAFEPKVGSILLHLHGDHCLEHEADPVTDGIKYVLRTDLVFGTTSAPGM